MVDTKSAPAPPKSQPNDLLGRAVGEERINEYNWEQAEPVNIEFSKIEQINKDWGKSKALPKSDAISLDQLSYNLKEQLTKYHLTIENDQALNSIHNLLQNQLSLLNKSLECQLKNIMKAHSAHCNLLTSVILHNYSSESSFPIISPNQKKFLNALFDATDNFKNNQK